MITEIEQRIHAALEKHALERIDGGYRLVHPGGAAVSSLRFLPVRDTGAEHPIAAIVEIQAEYPATGLPAFHPPGIQRLNAMAVYGAYHLDHGRLCQTAQYSLYKNEPAAHLAAQSVLDAFGSQLPIGMSVALGVVSPEVLEQQRLRHAMPREWDAPLPEELLRGAKDLLHQRGLAASSDAHAVWAELPLSGTCPSRSIDPKAETALLLVNTRVPHPIAGAGYLSTVTLPLAAAPPDADEICRRLNELERSEEDFPPRIGAWGLVGSDGLPGYSSFIPAAKPIGGLHMAIMWWAVRRAAWLRDRFWTAGVGLTLESVNASAARARTPPSPPAAADPAAAGPGPE